MTAFSAATIGGIALGLPGLIGGAGVGFGVGKGVEEAFDIPNVKLVAPAKSLNMGFNILPGLGPYAQVAGCVGSQRQTSIR